MVNNISAKVGDTVTADYIGTLNNGTVFDTSIESVAAKNNIFNSQRQYTPLEFTIGEGQMIKGFDQAVVGMKIGETKKIHLMPEDAYGNVKSDLIIVTSVSKITSDRSSLYVGRSLFTPAGDRGVVTEIDGDNVTVDFNHPFAGKELNFEITLVSIN